MRILIALLILAVFTIRQSSDGTPRSVYSQTATKARRLSDIGGDIGYPVDDCCRKVCPLGWKSRAADSVSYVPLYETDHFE